MSFTFHFTRILLEKNICDVEHVNRFCNLLYTEKSIRSPYLLAYMVDVCENKLELGKPDRQKNLEEAVRVRSKLSLNHFDQDKI